MNYNYKYKTKFKMIKNRYPNNSYYKNNKKT